MENKGKTTGKENLVPFDKGSKLINRNGRPKKIVTKLQETLQGEGNLPVTKAQFISYMTTIIGLDERKWDEVKTNDLTPKFVKVIMETIEKDQRYKVIPDILDRIFGRAKEEFILNHKGENMNNLIAPIQVIINGQIKE